MHLGLAEVDPLVDLGLDLNVGGEETRVGGKGGNYRDKTM